ncbi:YqhR family membrane protein [Bacillus sp. B190/17]|uniref:YqhR family membrane protein n=1 Tax=Bacillus lumedeiriae TaxID=3058829 RepID=A0ABW8I4C3_9BACI
MGEKQVKESKAEYPLGYALAIGLFGGLIWSIVAQLAAYFHFMTIDINAIVKYVNIAKIQSGFPKVAAGMVFQIIVSVILAMIYYFLLRKSKTIWSGVLFGAVIWVILFMIIHPFAASIPSWQKLNANTLSTTICLLVLYGLFIGYSISYGYEQHLLREQRLNAWQKQSE